MSMQTVSARRRLCAGNIQKNVQGLFTSRDCDLRRVFWSRLVIDRPHVSMINSSGEKRFSGESQYMSCNAAQKSVGESYRPGILHGNELPVDSSDALPSWHGRIDISSISEKGGYVLATVQGKSSYRDAGTAKGILGGVARKLRRAVEPDNVDGRFQDFQAQCKFGQFSLPHFGKPLGRYGGIASRAFSTTLAPPDWGTGPPERLGTDPSAITELALDSVVKIFTMASSPNYFLPWQNKPQREMTGSGFVISGRRIVTNAHVVADQTYVVVRKHGSPSKYRAEVQAVGHECDLALLRVMDEDFWDGMRTLQFGDIPYLQESVAVVGYPQGGDNISVTGGVVSRVEPTQYVHGTAHLMAIQIDAAINPGNSGGPALMEDKVVGVAFQNLAGAENIGYIIPVPIIKHFLEDVEEKEHYVGFCSLGLTCQATENSQLRDHLHMPAGLTGVLVNKIQPLTDTNQWVKKDDVLLAFDGAPIANDGTVHFRNRERISFDHLVSMKKAGEKARVTVLRDGRITDFNVKLDPLRFLVPIHQFDRLPSYFIFAGLVFTPLTQPYLHEYGDDWYNTAPRRLCEKALTGILTKPGEQLVILSQVLMDEVNAGYERLADYQVQKVNDVEVHNLKHLKELVEGCSWSNLRFDLDDGRVVVLNFDKAREASLKILLRHRIPSHASIDLLQELPHGVDDDGLVPQAAPGLEMQKIAEVADAVPV